MAAPALVDISLVKIMEDAFNALAKLKMEIQDRNEKKPRYADHEPIEESSEALQCTMHSKEMLKRMMTSQGVPELVDVDMLSMTIFTCIGYWRTFEVISEDDEETYRSIGNEVVARHKIAT